MGLQVLLIAESLIAVRERTGEGLRSIVHVHVAIKADLRGEYFPTPFLIADEWLVAFLVLDPARIGALA